MTGRVFVLGRKLTQRTRERPGRNKKSDLAVLGAQMGPDTRNFKSYSHITALKPVATTPSQLASLLGSYLAN